MLNIVIKWNINHIRYENLKKSCVGVWFEGNLLSSHWTGSLEIYREQSTDILLFTKRFKEGKKWVRWSKWYFKTQLFLCQLKFSFWHTLRTPQVTLSWKKNIIMTRWWNFKNLSHLKIYSNSKQNFLTSLMLIRA